MSHLLEPKVERVESSDNYGSFASVLEKGFGVTLGNALRRVLLSSLPGAAVTHVSIEGVQHQFSTIPHVKEDVIEFLLNVRQIRLRPLTERPGKLLLKASGEGEICAADIQPSAEYEIANPELHLATLDSSEARLKVEFDVEQGKGYLPASYGEYLPMEVIPVDAIFTPIRKVNYRIEPARGAQSGDYERLIIEIWTDGTILPQEALSRGAQILVDQFKFFTQIPTQAPQPVPSPPEKEEMPIELLELPARILNCLKRNGLTQVGELLKMSDEELLALSKFGPQSLEELKVHLKEVGFTGGEK